MANVFASPDLAPDEPLRVSDRDAPAPEMTSDQVRPLSRLDVLDTRYGPLRFGNFSVSRQELHALGARLAGQPIDGNNSNLRQPDQPFIDALQFDANNVEARIRSAGASTDNSVPALLFEIASQRSVNAPALLSTTTSIASSKPMGKIDTLLKSAQKLEIRDLRLPKHLPSWVDQTKSHGLNGMGVGLQAYGIYSGLMGAADALRRGDQVDALINAGGTAVEVGSLIIERGVAKGAQAMIEAGAGVFRTFPKTSFGMLLKQGSGLIGSLLTLPFDLYTAVKAFNDAALAKTDKEAMDHYVNAGLSLTSASVSLILGTAALAGFSNAGPLGLAAAAILIMGSRIYSAVRQVDDIDDYITLTAHERLRSGWFAFTGQAIDQDILNRHSVARASVFHTHTIETRSKAWLASELKDSVEAIVNGTFEVTMQPIQIARFEWDADAGQSPFIQSSQPTISDSDDHIDAADGVTNDLPGAQIGSRGESKATLFVLGGGNDVVTGVKKKPNQFSYGAGTKRLTGGDKDDHFLFETAADTLKTLPRNLTESALHGGPGNDTLSLRGAISSRELSARPGYAIDLQKGRLAVRTDLADGTIAYATFDSIENVQTLAGASNHVTGSDAANLIIANGSDTIEAGLGDDRIYLLSGYAKAAGGGGKDHYFIAHKSGTVIIAEDAQDESVIELGWRCEEIQSWAIDGTSLVVTSRCGVDGELPERTLIIESVYTHTASTRQLQNAQLRFITLDQFQLIPDLPNELPASGTENIKALIWVRGKSRPAPIIANSLNYQVPHDQPWACFIDREIDQTCFSVGQRSDGVVSTLYVECDAEEIESVEAYYSVEKINRNGFTYLTYKDAGLNLYFTNKVLKFKNLASSPKGVGSNVTGSIMAAGLRLNHEFILILRDGSSYRLLPPAVSYLQDAREPGFKTINGAASLQERAGHYLFISPEPGEMTVLEARPQRVDFPAGPQKYIYQLQGQASTYKLYLNEETTLHLSTPGARAKTSNASHWVLHARSPGPEAINPPFSMVNNKLMIGRAIVHLPDFADPHVPLEHIVIVTAAGHRYAVNQEFEDIHLYSVDAHAFAQLKLIPVFLHQQNELGRLANRVEVRHVGLKDKTEGTLHYDLTKASWVLDTAPSRRLALADLQRLHASGQ